jgi:hypothetical protein
MNNRVILEGKVTEDGTLIVHLPPDAPRGQVRITVEKVSETTGATVSPEEQKYLEAVLDPELEALFNSDYPDGLGLTTEEIARSPEIGIWKDRTDITDSVEFVAEMRRKRRYMRSSRT